MKLTTGVKNLLVANIIVFILTYFIVGFSPFDSLALFPIHSNFFNPIQLLSYMFLHISVTHILFNMFGLVVFGTDLENKFGTKKFIQLYFLSGFFAGLTHIIFSSLPVIGASGSIWALMAVYALLFPNKELYLYFLFPVKAKYIIGFFFILEFIYLGVNDGTSHLAHIGGAISGCLYYLIKLKKND
jgi:membrane associated rhomboid family serine protease